MFDYKVKHFETTTEICEVSFFPSPHSNLQLSTVDSLVCILPNFTFDAKKASNIQFLASLQNKAIVKCKMVLAYLANIMIQLISGYIVFLNDFVVFSSMGQPSVDLTFRFSLNFHILFLFTWLINSMIRVIIVDGLKSKFIYILINKPKCPPGKFYILFHFFTKNAERILWNNFFLHQFGQQ